jgi:hypothetical protein
MRLPTMKGVVTLSLSAAGAVTLQLAAKHHSNDLDVIDLRDERYRRVLLGRSTRALGS